MTSPASSGPSAPDLDLPEVTVAPGGSATTTLTVRNDSDIVEAYSLEIVGDCAAWTTVEPARVSLYPGTSETVSLRLEPPRSPEVRAGDMPLAVRVLPTEHPEAVRVPETVVHVTEFRQLRSELVPRRRRGWLRGRYRVAVRNEGNCPVRLRFTPGQPGEELRFTFSPAEPELDPGESSEVGLRVRTGRPVWFGSPVIWPFTVDPVDTEGREDEEPAAHVVRSPLDAEFVQIPLFPRWLLAVLAVLIALLLAWFMLVRPEVRSAARQAANEAVQEGPSVSDRTEGRGRQVAGGGASKPSARGGEDSGGKHGTARRQQHSETIDVKTSAGKNRAKVYTVPEGELFEITDIVIANFQGDEGVVSISFGDRKITTIALETFRNQDYHWVTPIRIAENDAVTFEVTCTKPGTPATGRRAQECHEVLNVSGVLSSAK